MLTIKPFLWFESEAEDAAKLYTSIFPGSEITSVVARPEGVPGPSRVIIVTFTIAGQSIVAMNGGPGHPHTDAFSMAVEVDTQAELDRVWDRLLEGGGKPIACGWLKDRFGVSWQVMPKPMTTWMASADPKKAAATAAAMMTMVKLDLAKLKAAHDAA